MTRRSIIALAMTTTLVGGRPLPDRAVDPIPAQVEAIYQKGLAYLSKTQNAEGYWPGDTAGAEPGVVGLCILAFLAHGEDPNHGPYARNIKAGINYIISRQKDSNGYISSSANGRETLYNHGFATLALAECYGMMKNDPRLAKSLRKAVDLILSAQKRNPHGAWRYSPDDTRADSSVAGCQIVALYAARNAGIPVPKIALLKGLKFMSSCRARDGSYGYFNSSGSRPTLTAVGSLCHSLAKKKNTKSFQATTQYLKRNIDHKERNYPFYFEYYMSQALFHADEKLWNEWNKKNTRYLSVIQTSDGSFVSKHGRAFSTSSALLSLALNYRFLPSTKNDPPHHLLLHHCLRRLNDPPGRRPIHPTPG